MARNKLSISEFYPEGTIVLHSFSKIVSPGLRIGCVEAKHEIIEYTYKVKTDNRFTFEYTVSICITKVIRA